MPQLKARISFLYGEAQGNDNSKAAATGDAMASAAAAAMSKSGRKSIPLNELIGVL